MKTSAEIKSIIKKLAKNYSPEKIIIFGSFAGGTSTKGSDLDLLIIKNTKKDPWQRIIEADKYIDHKIPVDLLVYTPEEIEDRLKINDFFISDIFENGNVVYEKRK